MPFFFSSASLGGLDFVLERSMVGFAGLCVAPPHDSHHCLAGNLVAGVACYSPVERCAVLEYLSGLSSAL